MPTKTIPVAIIQHSPVFLNLDASIDKACRLIDEASAQGARVIVFPETWLPGYPLWLDSAPGAALWRNKSTHALYRILSENALAIPGAQVNRLLKAAEKAKAYVIMGAHELRGGSLYNTMLFLSTDGKTYHLHRKLTPTYTERLVWAQGDGSTLTVIETELGRIGGLICWEHWLPLARAAMHAKNETIHVAQWPSVGDIHQLASRHYAFEGQCFVLAAGTILRRSHILDGFDSLPEKNAEARALLDAIPGDPAKLLQRGGSAIIAPDGTYVAEPVFEIETILHAEIDPRMISEGKMHLDTDGHYSRPDIFQLTVNTAPLTNVEFE